MRVMELADELGVSTVVIVAVCGSLGIGATWAGAELTADEAERIRVAGPPPPGAITVPNRYGPGGLGPVPPTAGPTSPSTFGPGTTPRTSTPPGYGLAPQPLPRPNFGAAVPPGFGPTAVGPDPSATAGPGAPPVPHLSPPPAAPIGTLPAGVAAPPSSNRIAALVPPGTTFAAPLPPSYDSVTGKAAGGRRAPEVSTGWTRWWRAVLIWFVTWLIATAIAYFIGMSMGISAGIPMKGDSLKILVELIFWVAVYSGGTGWATFTAAQGAYFASSAWGDISASNGRLKGHVGIVLLWIGAGLMAFVWILDTIAKVVGLFRF